MKILVTQEHIDKGEPLKCYKCPIAHAIQEATGDLNWRVYDKVCGNKTEIYELPSVAVKFVRTFDMIGATIVEPFEFDLPIEESVLK